MNKKAKPNLFLREDKLPDNFRNLRAYCLIVRLISSSTIYFPAFLSPEEDSNYCIKKYHNGIRILTRTATQEIRL